MLTACVFFAHMAIGYKRRFKANTDLLEAAQALNKKLQDELGAPVENVSRDDCSEPIFDKKQVDKLLLERKKALAALKALKAQVTQLKGENKSLEMERDILNRRLAQLEETLEVSDAESMREMIVNFTEESRLLLDEVNQLTQDKQSLMQRVEDMEAGGKGTAGTVVGLQRKLESVEKELEQCKAGAN